jgi:hypothetical protein
MIGDRVIYVPFEANCLYRVQFTMFLKKTKTFVSIGKMDPPKTLYFDIFNFCFKMLTSVLQPNSPTALRYISPTALQAFSPTALQP